jgi:hypothetical protein
MQIKKDRNLKILERERARRLREYHRYLLQQELPMVPEVYDTMPLSARLSGLHIDRVNSPEKRDHSAVSTPAPPRSARSVGLVACLINSLKPKEPSSEDLAKKHVMSMARPLGSKAKAFGHGHTKKKRKTSSKSKKQSKK